MNETRQDVHKFLREHAEGRVIETHAARIYLLETEAWKVKRAVNYDYLDFRKLSDRRQVLLRELELNKKTAPTLYKDVIPITQEASGHLAVDGAGEPVEWVLRMARFPAQNELSVIASTDGIGEDLAVRLGQVAYDLHRDCPQRAADGAELIGEILDEFEREFRSLAHKGADIGAAPVLLRMRQALDVVSGVLRERSQMGCVRRCHGDLHLRNIVLLDGVPTPFDALEFDERLGTCDVFYDLAFLLMDVIQCAQRRAANGILNAYCDLEDSLDALKGLRALPLFGAVRATVRAMVSAEKEVGQHGVARDFAEATRYLNLAQSMLAPSVPRLIAIGGLSGTGKTTIARALAPSVGGAFGGIHVRSDVERKRLAGVDPLERLPASAYAPHANDTTYNALRARAEACLQAGQTVIVDAVFSEASQRQMIEALASDLGCAFAGIWLEAALEDRLSRVATRRNDASDADRAVVSRQVPVPKDALTWSVVSTTGTIEETRARVAAQVPSF
ncbi:MAG: AAA family ATPase [Pseudomonadota bacterium]